MFDRVPSVVDIPREYSRKIVYSAVRKGAYPIGNPQGNKAPYRPCSIEVTDRSVLFRGHGLTSATGLFT